MPLVETIQSPSESAQLAGTLPGPALAELLAEVPLGALDEHALVEAMRAARRLTAWAESIELAAIGELDRRRDAQAARYGSWTVEMCRAEVDEISAALTLSGTAASIRLGMAISLAKTLPDTRQALAEGRIDATKARIICDGTVGITAELARKVEQLVLPDAPRLTARQLAARVRKAVIDADPQAFADRRKAAEKGRRLDLYDNPDGTSDLSVRDLPADAAHAAFNRVNALAAALKADGDPRPIDAIRADLTVELIRGRFPADLVPTAAGPDAAGPDAAGKDEPAPAGPEEPVRSGQDEPAPAGGTGGTTADAGVGDSDTGRQEAAAITRAAREQLTELFNQTLDLNRSDEHRLLIIEAARRIKDAIAPLKIRWCVITADADGSMVHGQSGYRPPAAMRRLVQARNGMCTFPTCRRRATTCDLDHTIPYHKGGPTCPCNIAPLCRGHHRLKQHPDWTLIQLWPGVLLWIAPSGHWYLVGPDP